MAKKEGKRTTATNLQGFKKERRGAKKKKNRPGLGRAREWGKRGGKGQKKREKGIKGGKGGTLISGFLILKKKDKGYWKIKKTLIDGGTKYQGQLPKKKRPLKNCRNKIIDKKAAGGGIKRKPT